MLARALRLSLLMGLVGLVFTPNGASAAPPTNDAFGTATTVATFPFSGRATGLAEATVEPGEPSGCFPQQGTVWYRLVLDRAQALRITLFGAVFADWVAVYRDTGNGIAGLEPKGCVQVPEPLLLTGPAGSTFYLQVGRTAGAMTFDPTINVDVVAAPANDDLSNARVVTSVPFSSSTDTSGATIEPGEPAPCTDPPSQKTVWHAYTPTSDGVVIASASSGDTTGLAAYTGPSVDTLSFVGCALGGSPLPVAVTAGTTYWFQTGLFGERSGVIDFTLEQAPEPLIEITTFPADPTSLEAMSLDAHVLDPAGRPLTVEWDFGDGTTAGEQFTRHRYERDGDYIATATATTDDGRTVTASTTVSVRTHDVEISALNVPKQARQGQQRSVEVEVTNSRYTESVEVTLFKSTPNGEFVPIGTETKRVRAQGIETATSFTFAYVFTDEDALATKLTFRAVATIAGLRDALPADNTVIAPATRVRQ